MIIGMVVTHREKGIDYIIQSIQSDKICLRHGYDHSLLEITRQTFIKEYEVWKERTVYDFYKFTE